MRSTPGAYAASATKHEFRLTLTNDQQSKVRPVNNS